MSDSKPETPKKTSTGDSQKGFPPKFPAQLAEFMKQNFDMPPERKSVTPPATTQPVQPDHPENFGEVSVKTKLDGVVYPLWMTLMKRAIRGKGLASHIIGVSNPPPPIEDPGYAKWQQRDDLVFNWIINNLATSLVN